MKTKEDILKSKGITPDTKFHEYNYLYKSILEAMEEHAEFCPGCKGLFKFIHTPPLSIIPDIDWEKIFKGGHPPTTSNKSKWQGVQWLLTKIKELET